MRLALAQLNFTVGAFDANFERMRAAIERARAAGADLVVFSELAATGYPPHDLLTHESFVDRNLEVVEGLIGCQPRGTRALGQWPGPMVRCRSPGIDRTDRGRSTGPGQ